MPSASSWIAARTMSSTERLCPRCTTSAPRACSSRRIMLIAASWPSNSDAAVTKRSATAQGLVRRSGVGADGDGRGAQAETLAGIRGDRIAGFYRLLGKVARTQQVPQMPPDGPFQAAARPLASPFPGAALRSMAALGLAAGARARGATRREARGRDPDCRARVPRPRLPQHLAGRHRRPALGHQADDLPLRHQQGADPVRVFSDRSRADSHRFRRGQGNPARTGASA